MSRISIWNPAGTSKRQKFVWESSLIAMPNVFQCFKASSHIPRAQHISFLMNDPPWGVHLPHCLIPSGGFSLSFSLALCFWLMAMSSLFLALLPFPFPPCAVRIATFDRRMCRERRAALRGISRRHTAKSCQNTSRPEKERGGGKGDRTTIAWETLVK